MLNPRPEIKGLSRRAKPERKAFQIQSCFNSVFLHKQKQKNTILHALRHFAQSFWSDWVEVEPTQCRLFLRSPPSQAQFTCLFAEMRRVLHRRTSFWLWVMSPSSLKRSRCLETVNYVIQMVWIRLERVIWSPLWWNDCWSVASCFGVVLILILLAGSLSGVAVSERDDSVIWEGNLPRISS